jgi:alpha-galactosidase
MSPILAAPIVLALSFSSASGAEPGWADRVLDVPYAVPAAGEARLFLLRQDFEKLERNRSVIGTPLRIGEATFRSGLGTHSTSHIRVESDVPIERFSAFAGVDANERTRDGQGSVVFSVEVEGKEVWRSKVLRGGGAAERVDLDVRGAKAIDLKVGDAGDGPACDHADWAEARIAVAGGRSLALDALPLAEKFRAARHPFSFRCGGRPSDDVLAGWKRERKEEDVPGVGRRVVTTWADPSGGLAVEWEALRFADFDAVDWVFRLENRGRADTALVEDFQALDLAFRGKSFVVRRTKGAPSDPTDFEPAEVSICERSPPLQLGGGGGRSSNRDFPFIGIEGGEGRFVVAVGWSGQWACRIDSPGREVLHATAGLERTRFVLHPGERVRAPRIVVLRAREDPSAEFRELVLRHYAARRPGKEPLPILFSNTCFTRGGGWLNECDAANQISLIKAYAPLGLEAVITDAGWFEGGWPAGAGNWTPRKDAYPEGMGPVAAAAKERGMVYGLWFEPERVVAGTWVHKNHPEWCLPDGSKDPGTFLLDFGNPAARDWFFGIVKGFMDLPGFGFYRQDFNMDPLPHWRASDAPDRQGITEMKYIEGLYEYWDRIAAAWPDSIREECASGGRRIDIETVRRMHVHQESDYWFDPEADQCQIWGLSQYLPNETFTTPIAALDDYSFRSAMATSLIVGWIADDPGFDAARAKRLLDRYREVRHLLVGAWHPLLPYSRRHEDWMASQFHRKDLDEGMVLAFRRPASAYRTADLPLRYLAPDGTYELSFDTSGEKLRAKGADLARSFLLTIPERRGSELVTYRRIDRRP